ncbi:hypothetical protein [Wenjunlia tyrosinilytica]|uniref:Uncharacterized protein n=1 Tax=Wenjunlia tyrosinilytica TaxID=1544741 RepID=A0A918E230_9ACTN|nr:hypothetical protein [Wenjunlia tyrosinilytica]GGO98033.1 hypothetical protein GCM10012280_61220 [Wenjunlia tyrosinilytica]
MGQRYRGQEAVSEALVLEVSDERWSSRICSLPDGEAAAVLVSLPSGLFVAHDAAMRRTAGFPAPAVSGDVEYLTGVWGFTDCSGSGWSEVADVPLIRLQASRFGLTVELSGWPWLVRQGYEPVPASWIREASEGSCLLGICFGTDLYAADAEEQFMNSLLAGEAVLGQVGTVWHR